MKITGLLSYLGIESFAWKPKGQQCVTLSNSLYGMFLARRALHTSSDSYKNTQRKYHILSIDGGGIRGIIPGKILQSIEKETGPIAKNFDMIGGTSTGGILGLGLSLPDDKDPQSPKYTASEVLNLYLNQKLREKIFTSANIPPPTRSRSGKFPIATLSFKNAGVATEFEWLGKKVVTIKKDTQAKYQLSSEYESIHKWIHPKFLAKGVEEIFKKYFGSAHLSDLIPKETLVTAFNTTAMRHAIWSKSSAIANPSSDIMVWEAARATSAAPTYFPAFMIQDQEYIDGGVCLNNPIMAMVSRARKLGIPKRNLFCVSLGTGRFTKPIAPTAHFGRLQWAANIFDTASCGISSQTEEYIDSLLNPNQYVRIQIDLPENIALDRIDRAAVDQLQETAERAIQENAQKLEKVYQSIRGKHLS